MKETHERPSTERERMYTRAVRLFGYLLPIAFVVGLAVAIAIAV